MYALEPNGYTHSWEQLGQALPVPKAILMISAHWYTSGIWLTAMEKPATIHDFYGFPQALFDVQYPARGSPSLAHRVKELLTPFDHNVILENNEWGLDHGAWSVLKYLYPDASIPCIQLSIDASRSPQEHFEIAQLLQPLREEGVLILSSGNIVHNLRMIQWQENSAPYDWAKEFNEQFKNHLLQKDYPALVDWQKFGKSALLSVPTAEHYLPAIYTIGTALEDEVASIIVDGIEMSSISMLAFGMGLNL
jgi:4,5-DOPA dioxygenase extradiol